MINWPDTSNRSLWERALDRSLPFFSPSIAIPILRGPLKGKKWILAAGSPRYWLGNFEYERQNLFAQTIERDTIVFDIGAYHGIYTMLAAQLVGERGRVYAFEPSPRNATLLKKHIALNHLKNVRVCEDACADRHGQPHFASSDDGRGRQSVAAVAVRRNVFALDEQIGQSKLPIPDYLRIDIADAEWSILQGAWQTLAEFHPTIFLTIYHCDTRQQCNHFLETLGYKIQPVPHKNSVIDWRGSEQLLARYS